MALLPLIAESPNPGDLDALNMYRQCYWFQLIFARPRDRRLAVTLPLMN